MPVMSESPRAWFPCRPENQAQADMGLHRLGSKQFGEDPAAVAMGDTVPIFQSWSQKQILEQPSSLSCVQIHP